jgi:hypothetical protein
MDGDDDAASVWFEGLVCQANLNARLLTAWRDGTACPIARSSFGSERGHGGGGGGGRGAAKLSWAGVLGWVVVPHLSQRGNAV